MRPRSASGCWNIRRFLPLAHPPKAEDLFNPHQYPTYDAGRGGQWTYHGPGQRIAYVMLDLHKPHGEVRARDVRSYVHGLEEWVIRTLAIFGLKGECREGRVGVWVIDPATGQEEKIAAIGVRVSRWVSWHGVSINLNPRLSDFEGIVPCGIREFGVTSFEKLGLNVTMAQLDAALEESWQTVFGSTPSALTPLPDE
ncbi:Octanoate-[acyl-carrier-protein]-protein-N-octan oyltransferase [Acetobacter malorum]|uniref:Octanoyltransferase n=1 Tax=Acetobacter malorum TaxID=178901 RepID=A0A177GAE6_9PROT|nr:Octanoate-[acyl-carrier-protein]-protein-N-octan oyltransferase [Acetobacter malorum]